MINLIEILDAKYPQFNTTSQHHLLTDALYQMCFENVEYLIVLEGDQFIGVLSEHDVAHKILFADKPLAEITVGELMNRKLPVANTTDTFEYAMQLLDKYNTRHLAIYDGFVFKGVVSETDLLKNATGHLQEAAEERAYPWNY